MEITTYHGDIRFLETELILAGIYEDERPPQGISGGIDWYLSGQITELLLSGNFSGKIGQFALLAAQEKIIAPKILIFGMGKKENAGGEVLGEMLPLVAERIRGLMVRTAALGLLGAGGRHTGEDEGIRLVIDYFRRGDDTPDLEHLTVIPGDKSQQETVERILRP